MFSWLTVTYSSSFGQTEPYTGSQIKINECCSSVISLHYLIPNDVLRIKNLFRFKLNASLCFKLVFCFIQFLVHLSYLFQMEKCGPLDEITKRRHLKNDDRENMSVDISGVMGQSSKRRKQISYARKYDCSYIQFEFCSNGDNGVEKPQCVICGEILSNDAMKTDMPNII